jgi:transcriptional regulator with PAS, ATPase and Fis domain
MKAVYSIQMAIASKLHSEFGKGRWMNKHSWVDEFSGAVTVCDPEGIILEMNDKAAESFKADGGKELIGKNLLDCHSESSRAKVKRLLETREKNVYTIEKNGVKKLVYQAPCYQDGKFAGLVEVVLEIPFELPHFVRG